jgi:hypothetical protein
MIKLLNNKEHKKEELISKMHDDSFYYGELGKLAFSSSIIKLLLDSPKVYHYTMLYGNPETQPLRDGRLIHMILLEPNKFYDLNFINVASKNTKAYKEAIKEYGVVYTKKEKENAERVADAFLKNENALRLLKDTKFEVPSIEMLNGYAFRGKADILTENGIIDLKTSNDVKNSFRYSAKKYHYDVQCYIYCKIFKRDYENFKFLVIDKGSLDIALYDCSEEFYKSGEQKVNTALKDYIRFFEKKEYNLDDYIITGIL